MDTLAAYGSDSDEDSSQHEGQSGTADRTDGNVQSHYEDDTTRTINQKEDSVSLALLPPPLLVSSSTGSQQSMMNAPRDYLSVKQKEWVDTDTGASGGAAPMPQRLAQIMSQQQQQQQGQNGPSHGWAVDHLKKQHEFYNPHLFAMVVEEYGLVDNIDGTAYHDQKLWDPTWENIQSLEQAQRNPSSS